MEHATCTQEAQPKQNRFPSDTPALYTQYENFGHWEITEGVGPDT